jgi:hypothetical protein
MNNADLTEPIQGIAIQIELFLRALKKKRKKKKEE